MLLLSHILIYYDCVAQFVCDSDSYKIKEIIIAAGIPNNSNPVRLCPTLSCVQSRTYGQPKRWFLWQNNLPFNSKLLGRSFHGRIGRTGMITYNTACLATNICLRLSRSGISYFCTHYEQASGFEFVFFQFFIQKSQNDLTNAMRAFIRHCGISLPCIYRLV